MKYEVGDRVQVLNVNGKTTGEKYVGEIGKVTKVNEESGFPYCVQFDDVYDGCVFREDELSGKDIQQRIE